MAAKSARARKIGRDAETGQFITVREAKDRPKTTIIETLPPPKKPSK